MSHEHIHMPGSPGHVPHHPLPAPPGPISMLTPLTVDPVVGEAPLTNTGDHISARETEYYQGLIERHA